MHALWSRLAFAASSLVVASFANARAVGAGDPQSSAAPPVASRPVEDFFRRPKYVQMRLSPDGALLAAVVPLNGHRNLALIDLDKLSIVALTALTDQDVHTYQWIGDRSIHVQRGNIDDAGQLGEVKQDALIDTTGHLVGDMLAVSARGRYRQVVRMGCVPTTIATTP